MTGASQSMTSHISTGLATLDELTGGGLPKGKITLVYGEPSTGKTTLALNCAANLLKEESSSPHDARVLYVDSDRKFSPERFSQIAGSSAERYLRRIYFNMPRSFLEQTLVAEQLGSVASGSIRLVVFDSITSLYREELANTKEVFHASRELNRQLAFIKAAATLHGFPTLIASQVYSAVDAVEPSVIPVSSRLLSYWSDAVLRLDPASATGIRTAWLEKPRRSPTGWAFRIGATGLVDAGLTQL